MSAENKTILSRIYETISQGNLADLDQVIAPDIVDHNPAPGQPAGLAGIKQTLTRWRAAFPDLNITAEELITEGDKVASRVVVRGTNSGEFMGIPPTGKPVTLTGMEIARIAEGKVVERWGEFDMMGMMVQLGVVPPPEQSDR